MVCDQANGRKPGARTPRPEPRGRRPPRDTLLTVGITQLRSRPARPSSGHASGFLTGGAYAALFLLGLAEGVLGAFQYSRGVIGPVPLGALGFCLAILATCALGSWALRGLPGALLPAIGWFVASFGLAMPDSGGSVIIANTVAGQWYLYGGAVAALLGIGSAFLTTLRRPPAGLPLAGRPLAGRPLAGRPPTGRPPTGRPPTGRPPTDPAPGRPPGGPAAGDGDGPGA
jgi:hypothetical protein